MSILIAYRRDLGKASNTQDGARKPAEPSSGFRCCDLTTMCHWDQRPARKRSNHVYFTGWPSVKWRNA